MGISKGNFRSSYTVGLVGLSVFGLLLSLYTSYVEIRAEEDRSYRALCDISERISCTKVFTSRYASEYGLNYGRGFGIISQLLGEDSRLNVPNGFYGILYYLMGALLSCSDRLRIARLNSYLILASNGLSLYLAYLLLFVLRDMCIVCVTTYAINFISLILSLTKVRMLISEKRKSRTSKEE